MLGLNFEICLIYLDDVILHSIDVDSHVFRLRLLFQRLKEANLKLKSSKCRLFQKSVAFLGYTVSADGITTDPAKIETVQSWPPPRRLRDVRSFLGLCGYYRRFVPDFSAIAAPLHGLTRKGQAFVWNEKCRSAFDELKRRLTASPVLTLPRDGGRYVIDTDASDHGIGAVLQQIQDGEEKVIAYASRLYSDAEKRYCVTRKELLAVVYFLRYFRQYLLGAEFLVRTDHAALQWLRRTPQPIGQQGRWLEILEEFQFTVQHRAGRLHTNADAMSRIPCRQCGQCVGKIVDDETVRGATVTAADENLIDNDSLEPSVLKTAQEADDDISQLIAFKSSRPDAPSADSVVFCTPAVKSYWKCWKCTTACYTAENVVPKQTWLSPFCR